MIKQIKSKLTKKNKRGFTLIELIVVIAIVAVLAAIGIPAIAGQVTKAQIATCQANSKLVAQRASDMLTEAETAGDYTKVKDMDGNAVTVAAGTGNADLLKAALKSANLDIKDFKGTNDLTLKAIPDPSDPAKTIGLRVEKVVLAKSTKVTGEWPIPEPKAKP